MPRDSKYPILEIENDINAGCDARVIVKKYNLPMSSYYYIKRRMKIPPKNTKSLLPKFREQKIDDISEEMSEEKKSDDISDEEEKSDDISDEEEKSAKSLLHKSVEQNGVTNDNNSHISKEDSDQSLNRKLNNESIKSAPRVRPIFPIIPIQTNIKYENIAQNTPEIVNIVQSKKPIISIVPDEKLIHQRLVLQIRNYINCFPDKLVCVTGSIESQKMKFSKDLFRSSIQELETILEEIRVELSISSHISIFTNIFHLFVTGVEKSSCLVGLDLNGLAQDIESDPHFAQTIKILACEISLSLSPQKELLVRLARACTLRYQLNTAQKKVIGPERNISDIAMKYGSL